MPFITIRIYKGQTLQAKKNIVKGITDVVHTNTGIDPAKVSIVFEEFIPENWAVGGITGDER